MNTPSLRRLTLGTFFKELWQRFLKDDVPGDAAKLSYYLLFSLFPLLVFLVSLVPIVAGYLPIRDALTGIFDNLAQIMPKEAFRPIYDQFVDLIEKRHPKLLSFGFLVALWSASRATAAFHDFLNKAHRVKEQRSYIKVQLISIGLTVALAILVVIAFSAMVLGGKLGTWISYRFGVPKAIFSWIRWPVSTLVMFLAVTFSYYVLPDLHPRLRFVNLGALVSTGLWLLFSWIFTKYVENFGDYNATYGSIGGVIALMTWLYLSGVIFFLGGEINAILQQYASHHASREAIKESS